MGNPEQPDEAGVEQIHVERPPEPEQQPEGVIDPDDTHVEGVDAE